MAAAVGDGHDCHSHVLLSANPLVILLDGGKETGAMQIPNIRVAWRFFALLAPTNRMQRLPDFARARG